jgi:PAS domain S-box-containing protein
MLELAWLLLFVVTVVFAAAFAGSELRHRRLARELAAQARVAELCTAAAALSDCYTQVLEAIVEAGDFAVANLYVTDAVDQPLKLVGGYSTDAATYRTFLEATASISFTKGTGMPGRVWQSGIAELSTELSNDAFTRFSAASEAGLACALVLPIADGKEIKAICELFGTYDQAKNFHRRKQFVNALLRPIGLLIAREDEQGGLREREAELRAIIDSAADGIIWLDDTGIIRSANQAAQDLIGYSSDEMIGKNVVEFLPDHYRRRFGAALTYYFRSTVERYIGRITEVTGRHRDGKTFPLELTLSRLTLDDRELYTGIIRDVSDRKLMERRVSEFYSTVSHELRSPLASIRGSLGLIEGGAIGEVSAEVRELVSIARRNCERLIRLVNDILDAKRIEAGKLPLNKEPVRPDEIVAAAVEGMQSFAAESGVSLVTQAAAQPQIIGDSDRVVQVLTNLLSNAIKHSPADSRVDVFCGKARNGNAFLRFSVRDQGPGIESEQLEKLFSEFQQLDSSDSRLKGGTGLGLAISKSIVESLDGQIGVDNSPGNGATFWFELPIASTDVENARVESIGSTAAELEDRTEAN